VVIFKFHLLDMRLYVQIKNFLLLIVPFLHQVSLDDIAQVHLTLIELIKFI
jgi:hypothetical protein